MLHIPLQLVIDFDKYLHSLRQLIELALVLVLHNRCLLVEPVTSGFNGN
jgi:hypothetical protein